MGTVKHCSRTGLHNCPGLSKKEYCEKSKCKDRVINYEFKGLEKIKKIRANHYCIACKVEWYMEGTSKYCPSCGASAEDFLT